MALPELKWEYGQKSKLARAAGISKQHLNNIIHRRKNARPELAKRLENAALSMGINIGRYDWAFAKDTNHILFKKTDA